MVEKFSDYEGGGFLGKEGQFVFTVDEAELTESKKGDPMWKFTMKCKEGTTNVWHSLVKQARWSFNNLIKACLKLDTEEKIEAFECDYEQIGNQLVGKQFIATVVKDTYQKETKIPLDDGTFQDGVEEKISYKIDTMTYDFA